MFGYAVRSLKTRMVKIGVSKSLKKRIASYKTHCAEPVELAFSANFGSNKAARQWEAAVLQKYSSHRSHGEWIAPNKELDSDIEIGIINDVASAATHQWIADGYLRKLGGEDRIKIERFQGKWTINFIGPHRHPMSYDVPDWNAAVSFANWYAIHGVKLKKLFQSKFPEHSIGFFTDAVIVVFNEIASGRVDWLNANA